MDKICVIAVSIIQILISSDTDLKHWRLFENFDGAIFSLCLYRVLNCFGGFCCQLSPLLLKTHQVEMGEFMNSNQGCHKI